MHAFDVLGDPVRRRILELLADGERCAGEVGAIVGEEFGISQPGVSRHLRVLREGGFATVREEGVTVDLDAGGHIIGIEILDAAERLGPKSLQSIAVEVIPLKALSGRRDQAVKEAMRVLEEGRISLPGSLISRLPVAVKERSKP